MKKKGIAMSFGWIFAIIVGAAIIFLAIYGTTRIVNSENKIQDSEIAKELGIILSPFETSIEESRRGVIFLNTETTIFNECDPYYGTFGLQDISVSSKTALNPSKDSGARSSFKNKYIFSSKRVEGKEISVFSKPFKFPFKIADLIFMWSENEKFCLINPPGEIEEEIESLNLKGVSIVSSESDCPPQSQDVKITVPGNDLRGRVIKGFDEVYYDDSALLFGAVFADPQIYECQIKRLSKRASELALVYRSKSSFLAPQQGCGSGLDLDLERYTNKTFSVEKSFDLADINSLAENLRRKNSDAYCKIF